MLFNKFIMIMSLFCPSSRPSWFQNHMVKPQATAHPIETAIKASATIPMFKLFCFQSLAWSCWFIIEILILIRFHLHRTRDQCQWLSNFVRRTTTSLCHHIQVMFREGLTKSRAGHKAKDHICKDTHLKIPGHICGSKGAEKITNAKVQSSRGPRISHIV